MADARADLTRAVANVAAEAGQMALARWRTDFRRWEKTPGSPVCEVDLDVDAMLRVRLAALLPDAGWLSEESVDNADRLGCARVWVVDPIDGTRAYVNGRSDWSVSVALVEHGRPIAGAVFAPMEDGLYLAIAGEGATRDGVALAVSPSASFENARAAGPKPMLAELGKRAPTLVALPKIHSLALRLARVASGKLEIAFASQDSHDWDLAAADIIVHEAGGALTTLAGDPLRYNSREARHGALVAAGPGRHARAVAITRTWWR